MDPQPLRVAVVDDEDSVRKALHRLLRAAGMQVATFHSGDEFLAAPHEAADCLVMDLHMPGSTGLDVVERLANSAPALPVVILTAHDKPEYRVRARELGVSAFLCKPVEAGRLLDAIEAAIAD